MLFVFFDKTFFNRVLFEVDSEDEKMDTEDEAEEESERKQRTRQEDPAVTEERAVFVRYRVALSWVPTNI